METEQQMKTSSTLLEKLPNELFAQIFSYLNGVDVIFAFSQLNNRFQCLLFEFCQYFDFKSVSKIKFAFVLQQHNLEQWKSLKLSNDEHTPGQIQCFYRCFFRADFYPKLKSLLIPYREPYKECTSLSNIPSLANLESLTIESVCGQVMSNICLPKLKRLVLSSCKNIGWIKNFPQLENIEYIISNCRSCYPTLTWPLTLKRLKIIFNENEDLQLIQTSLIPLSKLITLEIYQKERRWLRTNGQIWEELIRSSLPLLKHFKFFFQFIYLSSQDTQQMFASFSTPFYVHEKKWLVRFDIRQPGSRVFIYTVPFTFNQLTIISNFPNKTISTYFNNNDETSNNNMYNNVKTLVLDENVSDPDNSLNKIEIINLILNSGFVIINWIHILTKLRHLEITIASKISLEDFLYLLDNTPDLNSLTANKIVLEKLTENWSHVLICNHLSKKIQSLKLISSINGTQHVTRNELKQIIQIFASICKHLSLPIRTAKDSIRFILQNMSQLHSLHVNIHEKSNKSIAMHWPEKHQTKYNYSDCMIVHDRKDYYLWLG